MQRVERTDVLVPSVTFRPPGGSAIEGQISRIEAGELIGWLWCPERPDERLDLELIVDGQAEAQGFADHLCVEWPGSDVGDGWHGFSLRVPEGYFDSKTHRLALRLRSRDASRHEVGAVDVNIRNPSDEHWQGKLDENLHLLFDSEFYATQAGKTADPFQHYCRYGWKRGLDPHPLFSTSYYIRALGRELIDNPLIDFLRRGSAEMADVHPLLDNRRYVELRPDLLTRSQHPLLHYMRWGFREDVQAFRVFDQAYYLQQCPGLVEAGFPPLLHYIKYGRHEGKRPHRLFDPVLIGKLAGLDERSEPLSAMVEHFQTYRQPPSDEVETSIVILNLSKSVMTLCCLYLLRLHTDMSRCEIVVVDNGSNADEFSTLAKYGRDVTVIRSNVNLGFGEANNVAVERARGRNIVLLNNDAFVCEGWLEPLVAALDEPGVGAAGPMFLYPDGTLQEAGASIFADGAVHQIGKGAMNLDDSYTRRAAVDYLSAATLILRRELFDRVLGFDLIWDPAYYEDVDLCLKVKLAGLDVMYVPDSRVVHLENTTSSDASLNLNLGSIVSANRVKFVNRWSAYLTSRSEADAPSLIPARVPASPAPTGGKPLLALFTPFPIYPGGGEKYLFSIAHVCRDLFDCVLYTPQHTSRIRVLTLGRELGLDLSHVRCVDWDLRGTEPRPDYFISMGNELLPYAAPVGRRNLYICQYPFPMGPGNYVRDWENLPKYQGVIVYSDFVKSAVQDQSRRYGLERHAEVTTISPPIFPMHGTRTRTGVPRILNVGRFHPHGHCKRQDVMIEVFARLVSASKTPLELHLAGSLSPDADARDYFFQLKRAAKGLPVFFHPNNSADQMSDLFFSADFYWHATGIKDNVAATPERFEHFGMTILEAMSAGVVPIVLKFGGPGSIVRDGVDGFHVSDETEMFETTRRALTLSPEAYDALARNAVERAAEYSPDMFRAAMLSALGVAAQGARLQ